MSGSKGNRNTNIRRSRGSNQIKHSIRASIKGAVVRISIGSGNEAIFDQCETIRCHGVRQSNFPIQTQIPLVPGVRCACQSQGGRFHLTIVAFL